MKKTGQKTDYVMKYFSVIRIISAIAIALLIVFAIIFMVSDQPVFAIRKLDRWRQREASLMCWRERFH